VAKNVAEQIKPPTPPTSARGSRKVELTDNDDTETKEDETVPPADNDSDKPRDPENPKQQQQQEGQEADASEGTEAPAASFSTMVRAVTSAKQWRKKVKEAVAKRKPATAAQETETITPRQPTDPQPEAVRPMYVNVILHRASKLPKLEPILMAQYMTKVLAS